MIVCWPELRCASAGYFLSRELAASMLLLIPVPLLQRVTSGKRPRSNQEGLPLASGPTSSGSLVPSLFQGHAAKGHRWPIAALAASMLLNPLHNDSVRPPEGAIGVCLTYCVGFNGDKLRVIHPNCLLDIGCIAPRLQSSQKLHELFLSIGSQKMRVKWKIENEIITFVITVNSGDSVQKRVTEFV